jgi:hypothetical protein
VGIVNHTTPFPHYRLVVLPDHAPPAPCQPLLLLWCLGPCHSTHVPRAQSRQTQPGMCPCHPCSASGCTPHTRTWVTLTAAWARSSSTGQGTPPDSWPGGTAGHLLSFCANHCVGQRVELVMIPAVHIRPVCSCVIHHSSTRMPALVVLACDTSTYMPYLSRQPTKLHCPTCTYEPSATLCTTQLCGATRLCTPHCLYPG